MDLAPGKFDILGATFQRAFGKNTTFFVRGVEGTETAAVNRLSFFVGHGVENFCWEDRVPRCVDIEQKKVGTKRLSSNDEVPV